MQSARRAVMSFALVTLWACTPIGTDHVYDHGADFSGYRSFAWLTDEPLLLADPGTNPALEPLIRESVTEVLTAKGIPPADDPDDADLAVAFTLGSRESVAVVNYPSQPRFPVAAGTDVGSDTVVQGYTEGQLAIDIYDVATRRLIWHGVARKSLTGRDRNDLPRVVDKVVRAALEPFPPEQ